MQFRKNAIIDKLTLRLKLLWVRAYSFFFGIFTSPSWLKSAVLFGLIRFTVILLSLVFVGATVYAVDFYNLVLAPINTIGQVLRFYQYPFSEGPSIDGLQKLNDTDERYFDGYIESQSTIVDEFEAKRAIWHEEDIGNYFDFRGSSSHRPDAEDHFVPRIIHMGTQHPTYPPEVGFDPITGVWHEDDTEGPSLNPIGPGRLAVEYEEAIRDCLTMDSRIYTNFLSSAGRTYRSGFFDYSYDYPDGRVDYVPRIAKNDRFSRLYSSDLGLKVGYYYDSIVEVKGHGKPAKKELQGLSTVGSLGYYDTDTAFITYVNRYSEGLFEDFGEEVLFEKQSETATSSPITPTRN